MIVKELFVDMDMVLADFNKRFKSLFGELPLSDYPLISNNAKKKKYTEQFEKFIEDRNFATLEPMPDFLEAARFLNKVKQHTHVYILTSTAKEEYLKEISHQKKEWLKKHDISFYPIFVPGKATKKFYSRPGRVLIDDTPINIQQWNSMGGTGILHKSWRQSIKEYNEILEK